MKQYTYIDLFSGPGGLCTGFISEGFIPRIAVEWSDTTVVTYAKSHDAEIYELEELLAHLGNLEDVLKKTGKTSHPILQRKITERLSRSAIISTATGSNTNWREQ